MSRACNRCSPRLSGPASVFTTRRARGSRRAASLGSAASAAVRYRFFRMCPPLSYWYFTMIPRGRSPPMEKTSMPGPNETSRPNGASPADPAEMQRLLHDLQVHQIELEMQNQQLRETQVLLEESRSRYADLYDFAPVGYCTLDARSNIVEINLTGAAMLGVERSFLVSKP